MRMIVPYARSALGWRDMCTDDLTRTWRIICDVPCTDHRVFCFTTCLVMVAVDVPFLMIFRILITDEDITDSLLFPLHYSISARHLPLDAQSFTIIEYLILFFARRLRTPTDFRPKGIILGFEPSDRCIVTF